LQAVHGGRGVLLARIAGATPPQVVVIGCGNVGAAAARTAAALGAAVTVLAHSPESASRYRSTAPQGVLVAVNTPDGRRAALATADLVIGAILVSTFDTAAMVTEADLRRMRTGAVVVDATCGYGDGYLPTAGPVQRPGDPPREVAGVLHVKLDALPALVPVTATQAYTAHAAPYLARLARVALHGATDPAIEAARITQHGRVVHPVARQHAAFYGVPA
jgi:alanine dehydrogenase